MTSSNNAKVSGKMSKRDRQHMMKNAHRRQKYRSSSEYKETKIGQSKKRYATLSDFKENVKTRSKQKYSTLSDFKENVKKYNR